MASSSSLPFSNVFVERHKGFVIKLKLVGLGAAPQIRRVRLKNIAAVNGNISYDELVGLAIQFTFPNTSKELDDFDVTLTYYDVDNDCVTLATTEELVDAIEQYAEGGSGTLRLTTDVRKKKSKHGKKERKDSISSIRVSSTESLSSSPSPESVPAESSSPSLYPAASPSNASNHSQRVNGPQVLEALLESFVGILAAAVVALQTHLAPQSPSHATSTSTASVSEPPSPETPVSESNNPTAPVPPVPSAAPVTARDVPEVAPADEPQVAEKDIVVEPNVCHTPPTPPPHQVPSPKPSPKPVVVTSVTSSASGATTSTTRVSVTTTSTASTVPAPVSVSTTPSTASTIPTPAAPAEPEEHLFIHGRHTCDGCLCTPIVGKRFHATNLKDYDLCERCMENYKGSEIQFELAELDRDRVFQERWHRRRQKWSQCRPHRRHHAPDLEPPHIPPHGPPHRPPQPPHVAHPYGPPPPHGLPMGPPHGPPFGHPHGPPFGPSHGPPFHLFGPMMPPPPHFGHPFGAENYDSALKEAIQRSLKDMMDKAAAKPEESNNEDSIPELVRKTPSPDDIPIVVPDEPVKKPEPVEMEPPPSPVEVPAVTPVEHSEVTEPSPSPVETPALVEPKIIELPQTGPEPTIMELLSNAFKEASTDPTVVETETKDVSEATSSTEDDESIGAEVKSVHSEDSYVYDSDDDEGSDDEAINVKTVETKSDDGSLVEKFDDLDGPSFSSDAAGNGEVAEALGQTFDQCARVIDAMVSEINRAESRTIKTKDEDLDLPSKQGETILESVDDDTKPNVKDDEKSEDGWQVVTENQQITEDEALARAAQFVGSALFNSDISAQSAVISTLSGSGDMSSQLSSLPTLPSVVPSIGHDEASTVPLAQLNRWSLQLKQLHELGFHDDKVNVAILERIAAANVGADLFEEVAVTQVVNELLNGKMD